MKRWVEVRITGRVQEIPQGVLMGYVVRESLVLPKRSADQMRPSDPRREAQDPGKFSICHVLLLRSFCLILCPKDKREPVSRTLKSWHIGVGVLTACVLILKGWIGANLDVLADEAYYWVWSHHLAWGYFDQPPWIAWVIAGARHLWGDGSLALRAGPVLAGAIAPLFLLPYAKDKWFLCVWWIMLPPLFWLTLFSTPDAWLLLFWTLALGSALRGGRAWFWVGVWVSFAILSKYTGWVLLPLLWLGAGRPEWKASRWAALAPIVLLTPHLHWLAVHDFVSVRFPLGEGLLHPQPPGWLGPPSQVLGQCLVLTPFAALVAYGWMAKRAKTVLLEPQTSMDRTMKMCWFASAPLAMGFAIAAFFGPPEAHWAAPAWVAVGLALSNERANTKRWAWIASGSAGVTTALLMGVGVSNAPAWMNPTFERLQEGRALANEVERWVLPEGAARRTPEAALGRPVFTERYQEASLIHYHLGIEAKAYPSCAREDQYDLWDTGERPPSAWFIRPRTRGEVLCTDPSYTHKVRHAMQGVSPAGTLIGHWDLWEIADE